MKKNIIKLTESDLQNIIVKVIKEQKLPVKAPVKEIKKSPIIKLTQKELTNMISEAIMEQESGDAILSKGGNQNVKSDIVPPFPDKEPSEMTGASREIISAKQGVKGGLVQSLSSMEKLMTLTGLNPANDISGDIRKAIDKFDSLFGVPKETPDETED
jgi:hypothetical protein